MAIVTQFKAKIHMSGMDFQESNRVSAYENAVLPRSADTFLLKFCP